MDHRKQCRPNKRQFYYENSQKLPIPPLAHHSKMGNRFLFALLHEQQRTGSDGNAHLNELGGSKVGHTFCALFFYDKLVHMTGNNLKEVEKYHSPFFERFI